jgi:hypothetical protein
VFSRAFKPVLKGFAARSRGLFYLTIKVANLKFALYNECVIPKSGEWF